MNQSSNESNLYLTDGYEVLLYGTTTSMTRHIQTAFSWEIEKKGEGGGRRGPGAGGKEGGVGIEKGLRRIKN